MIQAKELRIGNFIFDDDGTIAKVIGFKPYEHSVRCDEEEGCDVLIDIYSADGKVRRGYVVESTSVSPIPITAEWLKKLGYQKSLADNKWYKLGSLLGPVYFIYDGNYGVEGLGIHPGNKYKYVHQLQNVYFALTGEELNVNL